MKNVLLILILLVPILGNSQLIISEYLEGSSNDKCIEIYNTTSSPINLAGYSLRRYSNGSSSPTSIALSGTIPACGTHVVCNSSSQAALLALADQTSGNINHNGDDAYDLFDGSTVLDIFGVIGCDPGSEWTAAGTDGTANNGYIRNSNVCVGITTNPSGCGPTSFTTLGTEWTTLNSTSDFSDLGSHTSTCCGGPPSNTITTTGVTGNPWTVDCTTPDAGTVTFTSTGTFNAGNIYTAQLSDPTGGFGSPINIGTLTSTANAGTINVTIPAGTGAGTQYRVRVVSDNPAVTGTDNGVDLTINSTLSTGTVIINEMSNGSSGVQEYFEMLVIGTACTEVNIQNLIFDDNNGDWGGSGVANGHYRFTADAQWGCVPTGTIIVVYNDGDPNTSLPADDETDANADNVYIIPVSSNFIETCSSDPNPGSAPYNVGGCTYSSGGTWTALGMSNGGDVAQTRDANGNFVHGIGYGGLTAPAGGVAIAGGGGGDAFIFDNSIDNDYTDPNNFSFGAVASFESPGAANTPANDTYIQSFACVVLPVEMLYFDLRQNETSVDLYWATASESNNDYFAIERSIDGINYEEIGTVSGMGTTSSASSYTFKDDSPVSGLNYYRIKQVDFNGESEYSGIRIANFKENNFSLINQYQSSDDVLTVLVKGMQKELDVKLYSIAGALMYNGTSYTNSFDIPTSELSAGIYIMQLESGGQTIRKKLYILK